MISCIVSSNGWSRIYRRGTNSLRSWRTNHKTPKKLSISATQTVFHIFNFTQAYCLHFKSYVVNNVPARNQDTHHIVQTRYYNLLRQHVSGTYTMIHALCTHNVLINIKHQEYKFLPHSDTFYSLSNSLNLTQTTLRLRNVL